MSAAYGVSVPQRQVLLSGLALCGAAPVPEAPPRQPALAGALEAGEREGSVCWDVLQL